MHSLTPPSSPLPRQPSPSRPRRPARAAGRQLAGVLLLAGLTACATSRSTRAKFLERVPPPQPLLSATTTYGGGAVLVQAWLGSSVRLRKTGEHAAAGERRALQQGRARRFSPDDSPMDAFKSPFEEGGEDADRYSKEEIDEMYGRVNYQYILPPRIALTLSFVNKSPRPLTVAITEVNSAMGNFAPRPESLTLGPGQEGRVDPMLSSFDNNFEALEVTLGIRMDGAPEEQVLHLRRSQESPPPAVEP